MFISNSFFFSSFILLSLWLCKSLTYKTYPHPNFSFPIPNISDSPHPQLCFKNMLTPPVITAEILGFILFIFLFIFWILVVIVRCRVCSFFFPYIAASGTLKNGRNICIALSYLYRKEKKIDKNHAKIDTFLNLICLSKHCRFRVKARKLASKIEDDVSFSDIIAKKKKKGCGCSFCYVFDCFGYKDSWSLGILVFS